MKSKINTVLKKPTALQKKSIREHMRGGMDAYTANMLVMQTYEDLPIVEWPSTKKG